MPKRRVSTRTSRQRATSRANLKKARHHGNEARQANKFGESAIAGMHVKKAAMFRGMAGGMKPMTKSQKVKATTIEPRAHSRVG